MSNSADERLPLKGELRRRRHTSEESNASSENVEFEGAPSRAKMFGYPIAILFILGNEFCERFSFYGMKTILIPYFQDVIGLSENDCTALAHGFNMLCYLSPLFGAIIADSYWGKYKTILIVSLVYAVGNIVMALTAIPTLGAGHGSLYGPIAGLIIIGIGTGGIKPCVSAFGGDQFDETEKEKSLKFFSFFYAIINVGSLISTFLSPVLKGNVACFGDETCYSLAFGLPAILMVISVIVFFLGGICTTYVKVPPEGNIFKDTVGCMFVALREKWRHRKSGEKRAHCLDWASGFYSEQMISDVKAVLGVLVIFSPLPFFWALYDQQGTMLVMQSYSMDSRAFGLFFEPEAYQVVNPAFILIFIVLFDYGVYPLVEKCGIRTLPLRRIGCGLFLAGVAFVITGFLELRLQKQFVSPPPDGQGYLSIINQNNKDLIVKVGNQSILVRNNRVMTNQRLLFTLSDFGDELDLQWSLDPKKNFRVDRLSLRGIDWHNDALVVVFFPNDFVLNYTDGYQQPHRRSVDHPSGYYKIRLNVVSPTPSLLSTLKIKAADTLGAVPLKINSSDERNVFTQLPGRYSVHTSKVKSKTYSLVNGGVYTLSVFIDENKKERADLLEVTHPFYVNIFWQLPITTVMTMAEILLSITGLALAYSQAPESMKSIIQAAWLLTIFFGNLIDVIIYASNAFKRVWVEFFFFAGLDFVVTLIFIVIAMRYKYVDDINSNENRKSNEEVYDEIETTNADEPEAPRLG